MKKILVGGLMSFFFALSVIAVPQVASANIFTDAFNVLFGGTAKTATTTQPSITVFSPNGDVDEKVIYKGWTDNISWTSKGVSSTVTIDLVRIDGEIINIVSNIANTGIYRWTVGNSIPNGEYRLRIKSINGTASDESDSTFTITSDPQSTPSLTVISPNGGEKIAAGSKYPLQWKVVNFPTDGLLKVLLIDKNNATHDALIVKSGTGCKNGDDGQFNILITCISIQATSTALNIPSWVEPGQYKLRVSCFTPTLAYCISTTSNEDLSDSYFTITSASTTQPSLTVISPNGGETFKQGDAITAKWSSVGLNNTEPLVIMARSSDGTGWNFNRPNDTTINDGEERSTLLNLPPDTYRLIIRNLSGTVKDEAYETFRIIASSTQPSKPLVCGTLGDVNGDGVISIEDVDLIKLIAVGKVKPNGIQSKAADVTGEGNISTLDAVHVRGYILGTKGEFPRCPSYRAASTTVTVPPPPPPVTNTSPFPESLGDYILFRDINGEVQETDERCERIEDSADGKALGLKGEYCAKATVAQYRHTGSNKVIFVHLTNITQGLEAYKAILNKITTPEKLSTHDVFRVEKHEIAWFSPTNTFNLIFTQEGTVSISSPRETNYSYGKATGDNPVTQFFLKKYPPTMTDVATAPATVSNTFTRLSEGSYYLQRFQLGFTLTAGNTPIYIAIDPTKALASTSPGLSPKYAGSAITNLQLVNPGLSTDPQTERKGYYMIPAGTSRTFTYAGIMYWDQVDKSHELKVTSINYGTHVENLTQYSITTGLQDLRVVAKGETVISAEKTSVNSGEMVNIKAFVQSNATKTALYISCPTGVNFLLPGFECNKLVPLTKSFQGISTSFINTSNQVQKVTVAYLIYTTDSTRAAASSTVVISVNPKSAPTTNSQPSITVTSPNGGENFKVGDTLEIGLKGVSDTGFFNTYLSGGGNKEGYAKFLGPVKMADSAKDIIRTSYKTTGADVSKAGGYTWKVLVCPSGQPTSSKNCALSGSFTITSSVPTATSVPISVPAICPAGKICNPHIDSVTTPISPGQKMIIQGVNLNKTNNFGDVLIDGNLLVSDLVDGNKDGTVLFFTLPNLILTNGLHTLSVANNSTVRSNVLTFEVRSSNQSSSNTTTPPVTTNNPTIVSFTSNTSTDGGHDFYWNTSGGDSTEFQIPCYSGLKITTHEGDFECGDTTRNLAVNKSYHLHFSNNSGNNINARVILAVIKSGSRVVTKELNINIPVVVTSTPAPISVNLSSSASSIMAGNYVYISWSSSEATSCSNNWSTNTSTSGGAYLYPSSSVTYSLTCSSSSQSPVTKTVYIQVNSATASPSSSPAVTTSPSTATSPTSSPSPSSTSSSSPSPTGSGVSQVDRSNPSLLASALYALGDFVDSLFGN